eukprot:scaffold68021_cov27-Cyclotella_meneghiniana.AAC.1
MKEGGGAQDEGVVGLQKPPRHRTKGAAPQGNPDGHLVRPLGYWSAGYEAAFGGFGRNHHGPWWPPCFGGGRNPPLRGENGINKLVAGLRG